jgi:type I restriction enzyme S subunit
MSRTFVVLGDLIRPVASPRAAGRTFPILSMTMHNGLVDQADKFKKRVASEDTSAYKVVSHGQLVVGFPIDEGVLSFQTLHDEAIVSPAYDVWDLKSKHSVDPSYLQRFLKSPIALSFYRGKLKSTTARRRTIPKETFLAMRVPLPPLDEQTRIAAILDQADALRRKRQRAIDRLNQLGQAIFVEMFGDPATNGKGMPKMPLGNLCRIRRGGSPRPIENFLGGTVPWIKIGDATKGDPFFIWETREKIHQGGVSKSTFVQANSLVFANCGVSLGFARITKIDGCIHDGWLVFDQFDSRIEKLFLVSQINLLTNKLRSIAPNGTQPNLNTGIMSKFEVLVPDLMAQQRFVEIAERLRAEERIQVQNLSATERLFNSIQHRAFNGEL